MLDHVRRCIVTEEHKLFVASIEIDAEFIRDPNHQNYHGKYPALHVGSLEFVDEEYIIIMTDVNAQTVKVYNPLRGCFEGDYWFGYQNAFDFVIETLQESIEDRKAAIDNEMTLEKQLELFVQRSIRNKGMFYHE